MVFNPSQKSKIVSENYPALTLAGCQLAFVSSFKYLGHVIENNLCDDSDINRELKCLYTRTNILIRRFHKCSVKVKITLFRTYCICLYDAALWTNYSAKTFSLLTSAYHKCIKMFFGYEKYCSVTEMLFELSLPSLDILIIKYRSSLVNQLVNCDTNNRIMCAINSIILK